MFAVLTWFAFILAALCLGVAVFILVKHSAEIRLLNPDSIREEQERKKRDELVQQRFNRLQSVKTAPLKAIYHRAVFTGKTAFHRGYLKLVHLSRFYEQAKRPFARVAPSATERIKSLLDEARSLARDLKWADAEKRYLEVLLMDNRNADAYKGMGCIYLKQKMYPQAKETYEYLIKTRQADDACCAAMAEICEAEGDDAAAEGWRLKAVEERPRLANRHAELAKFYADRKNYAKAWPSAKRATDLDPKSAKYQELALDSLIEIGDWTEAKRRYDKLRLLSEDQQRLQRFKERIEKIKPVM